MKIKLTFIALLLLAFAMQSFGQAKSPGIPYGDDVIIEKDESGNPRYVLDGRKWNCRFVTYFFENGTADIGRNGEHAAVERAMRTWEWETSINFLEVCDVNDADIRISWGTGEHGDGDPFDGDNCTGGRELAHAYFPPPNLGLLAGDIHFDDDELYTLNGTIACNEIDMETVALHELGHALGLKHSDRPGSYNAAMEAIYEGERRGLTWDDAYGARIMYGRRVSELMGNGIIYSGYPTALRYDYMLDCVPAGISIVNWDVDYPLQIVGQSGRGMTVEVPRTAINRAVRVIVRIQNECGQQWTYTRTVNIKNVDDPAGCPGCPIPTVAGGEGERARPALSLNVYPNPVIGDGVVHVEVQSLSGEGYLDASGTTVRITGVTGKHYREQVLGDFNSNIGLSTADLPVGLYFVQLVRDGDLLGTKRLIITK